MSQQHSQNPSSCGQGHGPGRCCGRKGSHAGHDSHGHDQTRQHGHAPAAGTGTHRCCREEGAGHPHAQGEQGEHHCQCHDHADTEEETSSTATAVAESPLLDEQGRGCREGSEEHKPVEGDWLSCVEPTQARAAIEWAFDYRGDVTLALTDAEPRTGFLFNRDFTALEPFVELFVKGRDEPVKVAIERIAAVEFTGADAAAGKSWHNWLQKLAAAKAQGTIAELYPDALD